MQKGKRNVLGQDIPVSDAKLKVTGQLKYVDDIKLSGMLYGKILFSPYPHAKIVNIDTSEAEAMDGVYAVVCHRDAPSVRYNGNGEDSDYLPSKRVFDDVVRYVGDKVAAVAAETEQIAAEAIRKIKVEYEQLPFYLSPEESVKPDAYPIHETGNFVTEAKLSCGNIEAGFAEADRIFENRYEVPAVYHAAMEPHVSIAVYDADGKLTVYTPSQDVFGQRKNLAKIFDLPMNKVRVVSPAMGGGFGGKIDLVTEAVGALLAIRSGRPVKIVYKRTEDIRSSTTRHAEIIYVKIGIKNDGTLTACDYKSYLSAGAQSGATKSVTWAAGGKFFKLFKIPDMRYHAIAAYTNRAIAGAMRGFGSPQLFFALNSQINTIANAIHMDSCELQLKNLHDPNECDGTGSPLGNFKIRECVKKGMELFDWYGAKREMEQSRLLNGRYRIGVGMATAPHGCSLYGVLPDTCGIILKMNEDGSITMFSGVSDMGNGSHTLQQMLVSEITGISMERIALVKTDTDATLFDVGAYASRGTYVGGNAARKAAEAMRAKILPEAAELLCVSEHEIELRENAAYVTKESRYVTMKQIAQHAHENERDIVVSEIYGTSAAPVSGGAHFVKLSIDCQTGEIRVLEYVAVHDVGKPLNPLNLEGQLYGGIQMGLGYALSEGIELNEDGTLKGRFLRDCHLFRAIDMPEIKIEFLDGYEETGPYGAKSIGECATVPSGAAVANAVANGLGHQFVTLPIRKEDVLRYIAESKK